MPLCLSNENVAQTFALKSHEVFLITKKVLPLQQPKKYHRESGT
jgi:hypothetical protein